MNLFPFMAKPQFMAKHHFMIIAMLCISVSMSFATVSQEITPLRIAVAANFSPVLKKLLPEFTAQTNIETQLISAASGTLFQQIRHGAPFDVFLSADAQRPQLLNEQRLIVEHSQQTYAYGQIAFWSAIDRLPELTPLLSKIPPLPRFAIANPDTAPYGKAAKQALMSLGLWQSLQNKLIQGININQTFQQVHSQAVKVGIVAYSQLKLNNLKGLVIAQQYYQPIEQQMVILKRSKQIKNAQQLSQYLLSDVIQKKLAEYGYTSIKHLNENDVTYVKSH
ncbi:MAG: molybdate transport system substrate-binding protein [Alteromonadaceae bacterium]|jgi:molybdate transport system substrate-binding protein